MRTVLLSLVAVAVVGCGGGKTPYEGQWSGTFRGQFQESLSSGTFLLTVFEGTRLVGNVEYDQVTHVNGAPAILPLIGTMSEAGELDVIGDFTAERCGGPSSLPRRAQRIAGRLSLEGELLVGALSLYLDGPAPDGEVAAELHSDQPPAT